MYFDSKGGQLTGIRRRLDSALRLCHLCSRFLMGTIQVNGLGAPSRTVRQEAIERSKDVPDAYCNAGHGCRVDTHSMLSVPSPACPIRPSRVPPPLCLGSEGGQWGGENNTERGAQHAGTGCWWRTHPREGPEQMNDRTHATLYSSIDLVTS